MANSSGMTTREVLDVLRDNKHLGRSSWVTYMGDVVSTHIGPLVTLTFPEAYAVTEEYLRAAAKGGAAHE